MDSFAREMQDVVRTLFPEEVDNKRQRNIRTSTPNSINRKKKKRRKRRSSVSLCVRTLTPTSTLVEVRNVASDQMSATSTDIMLTSNDIDLFLSSNPNSKVDKEQKLMVTNNYASDFHRDFFSALSNYPSRTEYLLIQDIVLNNNGEDDNINCDLSMSDFSTVGSNIDQEMEIPLESLSPKEIKTLRIMMMPPRRLSALHRMRLLLLDRSQSTCGRLQTHDEGLSRQYYHDSHDPSFWYRVLQRYSLFKNEYSSTVDLKDRLDMIFGFTWHLAQHPQWMTQHARGWRGELMVSSLAIRWRNLLKYDPAQIGIHDDKFSLPALICFLDNFKTAVEKTEMYGDPKMVFDYR